MIKILSECCCGEVGKGFSKELEYRNTYVNVCESCGEECDLTDLNVCDCCGEASEKKMYSLDGDDLCHDCMMAESDRQIQHWDEVIESGKSMEESA